MTNEIKEILTSMHYAGHTFASYRMKSVDILTLLDYITNLQEENERLKEENKRIFSKVNDDELLISNAMNYAEAQDYKQRIDKAIEYIETNKEPLHHYFDEPDCDYWIATNPDDLLNILRGDE